MGMGNTDVNVDVNVEVQLKTVQNFTYLLRSVSCDGYVESEILIYVLQFNLYIVYIYLYIV